MIARRPRLLCLLQLPPPVHGVAVVNQLVATSELLATRFELEVLPLAFATSFAELDRMSLRKLGRLVRIGARLAHALLARRPHAVYFTLTPSGAAFYRDCVFVAIMKLAGVPRIYHLHGHLHRKPPAGGRGTGRRAALYRWAFRGAWVIVLSERFVPELEDLVPRQRVLVVPNGVVERGAADRSERGGRARLLFLSNLTETKGPLILIEALGRLRSRGVAFDATFAGAVHERTFLDRFHAEVHRHGLEHHVRYVGPAYDEHKQRLLDEHDVFVLPTYKDAFPLVVLEAMQAGIPVVTTREGALPDIVEEGKAGLLVPPGDPVALVGSVATLIGDRDLQRRMGAHGRARCLQQFSRTAFEQNLAAALTTCIEAACSIREV